MDYTQYSPDLGRSIIDLEARFSRVQCARRLLDNYIYGAIRRD